MPAWFRFVRIILPLIEMILVCLSLFEIVSWAYPLISFLAILIFTWIVKPITDNFILSFYMIGANSASYLEMLKIINNSQFTSILLKEMSDKIGQENGCIKAFEKLKRFVSRIYEADRFDEQHLLPIATEIFGTNSFPLHTEYIALPKRRNSRILVTARRMTFESYYSFVLTDFFEGLHHGHYPRQCEVCKQYFLMQNARRQKYCTYGTAPELYHGEKISCRRYAIIQGKAERAKDNPLKAAYDRRCSAIRSEKSRGTISAEFAQAAQEMAKRRLEQAEEDDAYAAKAYYQDLERKKLYADTNRKMKS